MDIREHLQNISNNFDDRLKAEARGRLVRAGVASAARSAPSAVRAGHFAQMALAAALGAVLVLPALLIDDRAAGGDATPISGLTVTMEDGDVVVAWSDGGQPRRVVRATSRDQLADLSRLPARTVTGERWVDTESDQSDKSNIVFYIVE